MSHWEPGNTPNCYFANKTSLHKQYSYRRHWQTGKLEYICAPWRQCFTIRYTMFKATLRLVPKVYSTPLPEWHSSLKSTRIGCSVLLCHYVFELFSRSLYGNYCTETSCVDDSIFGHVCACVCVPHISILYLLISFAKIWTPPDPNCFINIIMYPMNT